MINKLTFLTLSLFATSAKAQFSTNMHVEYSKSVKDSFDIYISTPPSFNPSKQYNVVYYCDANLKSGKHLREFLSSTEYGANARLQNKIFVGIGQIGNYHVLRRRDFILPAIKENDTIGNSKNYGQTENFYQYIKTELVPVINATYKTNADSNAIIGHSLGGLFAFYCLFKADDLFAKYFALSPALWIDKYSIYKFNKIKTGFSNKKYLFFEAGEDEVMNKILKGANEAKEFLDEKKYENLIYEYEIVDDATHNSAVPVALKKILLEKL